MESLGRILNIEGGPSIFSLGTPLSTLGKLPRGSIHHDTPRVSHRLSQYSVVVVVVVRCDWYKWSVESGLWSVVTGHWFVVSSRWLVVGSW
jgi:hypothetical protein